MVSSSAAEDVSKSAFQFINVSNIDKPIDPSTRRSIRKQAMVKVAVSRREKGKNGKTNLGQLPVFSDEKYDPNFRAPISSLCSDNDERTATPKGVVTKEISRMNRHATSCEDPDSWQPASIIPASLSSKGYESLRARHDFDILNLSALTSFYTARVTAQLLTREPSLLANILDCRLPSYLEYLPSRFGLVTCLDDAACCVAARVRQCLTSPSSAPSVTVILLYSKAIASLQSALANRTQCLQSEVLCATALLAIYEASRF